MHRHGYKGRKFGRKRDQRKAMLKGLATQLIEHGSISTTLPKAKELRPYTEKLITKARKGGLHNRRQVISRLTTKEAAHRLFEEIAPSLKRTSGYLRIEPTHFRVGDDAPMATISFVDDIKTKPATDEPKIQPKPTAEKPNKKTATKAKKDDSMTTTKTKETK